MMTMMMMMKIMTMTMTMSVNDHDAYGGVCNDDLYDSDVDDHTHVHCL